MFLPVSSRQQQRISAMQHLLSVLLHWMNPYSSFIDLIILGGFHTFIFHTAGGGGGLFTVSTAPATTPFKTHLSGVERYFCFSKRFSRPMSCSSVNTVRLRRPFLVLPPPSAPCSDSFPRRCRSSGRWCDAAPTCRPGAAVSSGGPSGEPSEQDSGDMGNLRRLVWSAFSTKTTGKDTGEGFLK